MSPINSQAQPKENKGVPQGGTPQAPMTKTPGETEVCVIGAGIVIPIWLIARLLSSRK